MSAHIVALCPKSEMDRMDMVLYVLEYITDSSSTWISQLKIMMVMETGMGPSG
jgi:hypothetical protein